MRSILCRLAYSTVAAGLFLISPARANESLPARVAKLDALVGLTPEQKQNAAAVFDAENSALDHLPVEGRIRAEMQAIENSVRQVRDILRPDQQKIYDRTPTAQGGDLFVGKPEERVRMLDRELQLTPGQKGVALQVYTEEYETVAALPYSDRQKRWPQIAAETTKQIQALLAADQLAKKDAKEAAANTRAKEESDAMQQAARSLPAIAAQVGNPLYCDFKQRSARSDMRTRSGQAHVVVHGDKGTTEVVVAWERDPLSAPVKITRIVDVRGNLLGP